MHLSKHYDKKAAGCFCCLGMFLIFGYIDATNLSQVKGFAPEKLGWLDCSQEKLVLTRVYLRRFGQRAATPATLTKLSPSRVFSP